MQNEALTILTNYCVVIPGVSLSNPCILISFHSQLTFIISVAVPHTFGHVQFTLDCHVSTIIPKADPYSTIIQSDGDIDLIPSNEHVIMNSSSGNSGKSLLWFRIKPCETCAMRRAG